MAGVSFDNVPADLMSVREAAIRLQVCERTVWNYAQAGVLEGRQAIRPGCKSGLRRVTRRSVEAFINGETAR